MPNQKHLTTPWWERILLIAGFSALVFSLCGSVSAEEGLWPLRAKPDLSSGFGEFRQNRFHYGIDLRTGGRTGRRVISPVDGYVWRVKMSYDGYGKGLYVKGDDSNVYVFAHLFQFIPRIDDAVKTAQQNIKRYYLDKYFPKDSIRVSRGEVIAFSGQTGVGAPHLHFEHRSPENVPLNPLSHGFHLADTIPPVFTSLGIELTGAKSLLPDAVRRISSPLPESSSGSEIKLPSTFYLDRDFGIVVGCFDRMRPKGMKQTVYKLTLLVDGERRYRSVFDSLPFESGELVNFDYDQQAADSGDSRVRRLYRGDSIGGTRKNSARGILGPSLSFGLHRGLIIAEDNSGNISRLRFDFLWGGTEGIFTKDSVLRVNDSLSRYFFSAAGDLSKLGIDSSVVELVKGEFSYPAQISEAVETTQGHLVAEVRGKNVRTRVLRLRHFSSYGPSIVDDPFHGMFDKGQKALQISHKVTDDGLLVTVQSNSRRALHARLMLYNGDTLLGTEKPDRFFSVANYHFLVPPLKKYRRVDRIGVALVADAVQARPIFEKDLTLGVVGYEAVETMVADSLMSVEIRRENLFAPKWIEIQKTAMPNRYRMGLLSDVYDIFPKIFAVRGRYGIRLGLPPKKPFSKNERSGLCWLDVKEDEWVWLTDSRLTENTLEAGSFGGGSFAAVYDDLPPFIKGVNIVNERTYNTLLPKFEFKLGDSLSGIENDLSIVITIDDKWQIPEYDPEREICVSQPADSLSSGRHKLKIAVTDRAGNVSEEAWYFRTVAPPKPRSGSR